LVGSTPTVAIVSIFSVDLALDEILAARKSRILHGPAVTKIFGD